MAIVDFTPVQSLLGLEVCFRDLAFESSFKEYEGSFKDNASKDEYFLERFKFGRISGCIVDLGNSGEPSYSILVDAYYFNLSELEFLFVPDRQC